MSLEESKKLVLEKNLRHVAFIMDGNGRWAKKKGMPREYGHTVGAKTFKNVITYCYECGIECVTVYAFSTENWKRSEKEVSALMKLFSAYIDSAYEDLSKNNIRIYFIGDRARLPQALIKRMGELEEKTAAGKRILNIALNYGARDEILHAVNTLLQKGATSVDEETFSKALYTADSPDPDLVVRTAGEQRLSNFLLWQAAYSEFYYTDTLWPDMGKEQLDKAFAAFGGRVRRYGAVVE
ncbi:MAG: di-trans,poly-cis-decaprenylcistransferase [Clostridia bacterium]|nr:di-trans,poly-cis-decaprenylcistransferase [Clostridia bacterium]MBQ8236212.1 di-trans,poly-cis-decaprenylcistransferase [Clostridia bacterium]MBQ8399764.1 di-trans,poly-cis-decaprenylcistransferase [Clostridia bacterium]